jgi:hypothetical protein
MSKYQKGKYLGCVSAYEIEDGTLQDTLELIVDLIAKHGKDAELTFNRDEEEYEVYGPRVLVKQ